MASDVFEVTIATGQRIYVETDCELRLRSEQFRAQAGFAAAGITPSDIAQRFEQLAQFIASRSGQFIQQFQTLAESARPDKLTIEFAIGIEGSSGIPFLANGKGSANMTITAEWTPQPPSLKSGDHESSAPRT
jgi:inner membrane protein involved in colicin E2 resistance